MIGQSQSGTGKTAAFVLTMLSRVDFTKNKPQALCLAPSRELARQIMSVIAAMAKFTPVQTEYAIKDHLPRGVSNITAHIVVGTPGTMTDLIRRRVIDVSDVKVFVLDEADNMLDKDGLGDQTLRVKKCVCSLSDVAVSNPRLACSHGVDRRKLSSSQQPSPTTCVTSPLSSHRMRTRSNSNGTSCRSTRSGSSTWIARAKNTNTRSLSHSITS